MGILRILLGIVILLFLGIKQHPEYGDSSLFVKYRPSLKFEYYSPVAKYGTPYDNLTSEQLQDEQAYQQFVGDRFEGGLLQLLVPVGVPLMTFLMITGVLRVYFRNSKYKRRFRFKRELTFYLCTLTLFFIIYYLYWNFIGQGKFVIVLYFSLCFICAFMLFKPGKKRKKLEEFIRKKIYKTNY